MFQSYIDVNKVPTHVISWGKWIEEDLSSCKSLILCIPGNPGSTDFYTEFLETIYEKLDQKIPVWAISHAGHENPAIKLRDAPAFKTHPNIYNLKGQVEHKVAFINKYIPDDIKVYIIGHSIGAYIALELLENEQINKKIEKCYLLFPTIEYMAATSSGKLLIHFIKPIVWLILFLTWIFSILPNFLQIILIKMYLLITRASQNFTTAIIALLKPNILKRVFFMAFDEMDNVKARNDSVIENNKSKLKFYYSKLDQWTPETYFKRLKNDYPDIDAMCDNKYDHAFVLRKSKEMGVEIANWIKEDGGLDN